MSTKKDTTHFRAEGKTSISLSLPLDLKKKLMVYADRDSRSVSSYLTKLLKEQVDEQVSDAEVAAFEERFGPIEPPPSARPKPIKRIARKVPRKSGKRYKS